MVDLTGFNLDEDQAAKITALFDNELGGLKNKVDELLGEKKTVQQGLTEKEQALEEARKAAVSAEELRLVESGQYKEALALREKEVAEAIAQANENATKANEALMSRDKSSILNNASQLIDERFRDMSADKLSNMLKVSYNDQQEPIAEFIHNGDVVARSVEEFKGWASEQDSFKNILKGVESSGANTSQSHGGSAANGNDTQTKLAQRLKAQGL
jgi:hypothetical protein